MSEAPRRLLDDPELSDLIRQDLREASGDADVRFDASAGLERLRSAIGTPPTPASAGSTGAAAGTTKALIFGGIGLAVVAAIAIVATRPNVAAPSVASAPIESARSPDVPAPDPKPVPPAVLSIDDLPKEDAPGKSAPIATPAASAPTSPEERLRAEMKQLAEVRAAPPARALQLANEGHQRFKSGVFYQEREALAISALVSLGRSAEAKSRAQAFLATFPRGPYAERVRQQAGLPTP